MKVLMINGSPNENGCTYTALSEVAETLKKHGIASDILLSLIHISEPTRRS